jgi:hypothetical protein
MEQTAIESSPDTLTERRISWLTLVFGGLAALTATLLHNRVWGMGLVIGAVLSYFNFR